MSCMCTCYVMLSYVRLGYVMLLYACMYMYTYIYIYIHTYSHRHIAGKRGAQRDRGERGALGKTICRRSLVVNNYIVNQHISY